MPTLSPLAELTSLEGITYVYDPENVCVVYSVKHETSGTVAPHVWGITTEPIPIDGTAEAYLASLNISDQFVTLTGKNGPMQVRGSAVSLLLSRYAGVNDPNIKCIVFASGGPNLFFQVHEDIATVKALVNTARTKDILGQQLGLQFVEAAAGSATTPKDVRFKRRNRKTSVKRR